MPPPPPSKPGVVPKGEQISLSYLLEGASSSAKEPKNKDGLLLFGKQTVFGIVAQGKLPELALLYLCGQDLRVRDPSDLAGPTLLHYAASKDFVYIANYLLDHGLDPNVATVVPSRPHYPEIHQLGYAQTPLMWAVQKGSMGVAKVLLARGADVQFTDELGLTAAVYASSSPLMLHFLASRGADLLGVRSKRGGSLLHFVSQNGFLYSAVYLLEKAGWKDLDVTDQDGMTPLHLAAVFQRVEVAKLLISKGADLFATNRTLNTPLEVAPRGQTRSLLLAVQAEQRRGVV
eukprot:RCo044633